MIDSPEHTIAWLGVLIIFLGAIYVFWRWILACPCTPDPWGVEVGRSVEQEEAIAVCPRCLAPQEHKGWFCPECGCPSSQYANYLPGIYIFSIGDVVRAGLEQPKPWSILITAGYVFLAFSFFSVLAPVYCLFLFLNRSRIQSAPQLS